MPSAIRGTKDRDVGLAVAVIVPGHGHVGPIAPLEARRRVRARVPDIPVAFRRAKDRDVHLAVAVIISGHGNVAGNPESDTSGGAEIRAGKQSEPLGGAGAKDADVRLAVAVDVKRGASDGG